MGIDQKCKELLEQDIALNECSHVHQFPFKMEGFSTTVYNGNKLIFSGGLNHI